MKVNYFLSEINGPLMSLTLVEKTIGAIALVKETEPQHLDIRLQNWVETDAIRELSAHDSDSWELQFDVQNHDVKVRGDETVLVDGEEKRTYY